MKNTAMVKIVTSLLTAFFILHGTTIKAEPGTPWSALTAEQKQMLQKAQEERWNNMPAERQQRMLEGIERWQKMSPQDRERVRQERNKYKSMPPPEREALRQQHREAFGQLPPERQQEIRECWQRRREGAAVDCRGLMPVRPMPPPPPMGHDRP